MARFATRGQAAADMRESPRCTEGTDRRRTVTFMSTFNGTLQHDRERQVLSTATVTTRPAGRRETSSGCPSRPRRISKATDSLGPLNPGLEVTSASTSSRAIAPPGGVRTRETALTRTEAAISIGARRAAFLESACMAPTDKTWPNSARIPAPTGSSARLSRLNSNVA